MKTNFRTLELAIKFSKEVKMLELSYDIKNQLQRASTSIALNLAEGAARFAPKDKRRFYRIAYGSLKECQAALVIIECENIELTQLADRLGASIYRLLESTVNR